MKTLKITLIFVIFTDCLIVVHSRGRCRRNERYVDCPATMCIAQNCSQIGYPVPCPIVGPGHRCPSEPGCICIDGYLRNSKGVCIPKNKCPSCAGDYNAEAGCGFLCGEHCSCDIVVPSPCPCNKNGCQCKRGFIYDDNVKKCVLPRDCTPDCGVHEVSDNCANGGCRKWNCTQVDQPYLCIDPLECKGGCICQENYLRARNGSCIPEKDCYKDLCPKPYEYYVPCPPSCPARRCGFDDRVVLCAKPPEPGDPNCPEPACRCKEGYFRHDNGNCVIWEDCPSSSEDRPVQCSNDTLPLLLKGIADFTGKFLYEAHKLFREVSLIMSPFSVFVPMGELALYAENDTYTQLMKVLNLRNKNDIRCVFPDLTRQMRAENNIVLNLAARIFATDKHPLTAEFLNDTKNVFDAEAESLNFADSEAAASRINEWVESETNSRIKDIASPGMFSSDTRLVLANAIYFLGNWIKQFNSNNTDNRDFFVNSEKIIKIPTMYQTGYFNYADIENLDCKVLEMFYKGGNFSFVAFLPNKIEGISLLIEKLQDSNALFNAHSSVANHKVDIFLPKIKTESEFDLAQIMKQANINDLFDPSSSKLNNILQTYEPLFVSTAKQKAFVEVDETGTEAAAANIIGVSTTSIDTTEIKTFTADRPFAYYILYKETPIFTGKFHGT